MTATHEAFIQGVVKIVSQRSQLTPTEQEAIAGIKLVYGAGQSGLRGVTYFQKWKNGHTDPQPFVEICAFGEESWIQLAGTTIHELGHVITGLGAGHSPAWKNACRRLGLRCIKAAGTNYTLASLDPAIRHAIAVLPRPADGAPVETFIAQGVHVMPRPCSAGIGTRGGKSRGVGSGSRLRKYICHCRPPVIVRHAGDHLDASCGHCHGAFKRP